MKIIKKFKNKISDNERIFKIDTTHGTDVIGKIIYPFLEVYEDKGVKIVATGEEMERQLKNNNLEYYKPSDFYEKIKKKNGKVDYVFKEEFKDTCDLLIVWLSNYIQNPFLLKLRRELSATLVAIGDSFLVDYFSSGDVIQFLYDSDLEMNTVNNLKGYSKELLYFINRIRNGEVEMLKNSKNRSYIITNKRPEIEEMFDYDKAVTSNIFVGTDNRYIRELIFRREGCLPKKGDKMATYEMIQTTDRNGDFITLEFGEELTVINVEMTNHGYLICIFKTKDEREVEIWVDLKWLASRYGEDNLEFSKGGYKLFYSYVVPPELIIDKSYERLFFQMKSGSINNKRVMYSVGSSARKDFKICYDLNCNKLY